MNDPPLTDAELDAIEARAKAAPVGMLSVETDPPWDGAVLRHADGDTVPLGCGEYEDCAVMPLELATFWATARTDVLRLVAEVRRLRGMLKEGQP